MTNKSMVNGDIHSGVPNDIYQVFIWVSMALAVMTGIELVSVYLPFMKWTLVSILMIFAAVKFLFVILYFMHLRWNHSLCTIIFTLGLIIAGGTLWALIALFSSIASTPI